MQPKNFKAISNQSTGGHVSIHMLTESIIEFRSSTIAISFSYHPQRHLRSSGSQSWDLFGLKPSEAAILNFQTRQRRL